jgi:sulfatase maturation enzyme AslB (radical SAM superfamily)
MNPASHYAFGIYTLEITSYCNMYCSYCPQPKMQRPKGHMSSETLEKCISIFKVRPNNNRLVIHHFGEPLMHPKLEERLLQIAEADLDIEFSTNGLLLEDGLPMLLSIPAKIVITLSVHQWSNLHMNVYLKALKGWQDRVAGTNIEIRKVYNVNEVAKEAVFHNWTGGKDLGANRPDCFFLKDNWGVVYWNGDIVNCCADSEGSGGIIGNVHDVAALSVKSEEWHGCRTCTLFPPRG